MTKISTEEREKRPAWPHAGDSTAIGSKICGRAMRYAVTATITEPSARKLRRKAERLAKIAAKKEKKS